MTERPTPNYSDAERELRRVEESESAKMQDRTRAIVEAAERLAKHVQQLDVIDITGQVVDRTWTMRDVSQIGSHLVELARALALPEAPPVPESKLRAVYEAAEAAREFIEERTHVRNGHPCWAFRRLHNALSLPSDPEPPRDLIALARDLRSIWRHDADGDLCTVGPNDEIEGILRAWDRAVEKLDAPKWTKEPPTEPGWYFARWGGAPAGVVRVARGYDESDPTLCMWTIGEELCEPLSGVDVVEWWPVPIQPPEET